jgi:hypothetical protein
LTLPPKYAIIKTSHNLEVKMNNSNLEIAASNLTVAFYLANHAKQLHELSKGNDDGKKGGVDWLDCDKIFGIYQKFHGLLSSNKASLSGE